MSSIGLFCLLLAFAGIVVSLVCLAVGSVCSRRQTGGIGETLTWSGHVAAFTAIVSLTLCCVVLVFCFFVGDVSIAYVSEYYSDATGSLAWLYKLSGLWAGRAGSLLFWAWLISIFTGVVAARNFGSLSKLDTCALAIMELVLAAFVGLMLFSEDNMPFIAADSNYFNDDGTLTAAAQTYGMNSLLEHWAMAIHPPTLFVGYAGLTVPFAYALAALVVRDSSTAWVERSQRFTVFAWLFLTIGIALGALWAYTVLGWGGYWGWDAVENASLLPWLIGLALIHSSSAYLQRGAFKRWCIMCACLCFSSVMVATFITRSGIVESVHAFEGDPVSAALFGVLMVAPFVLGVLGLIIRWRVFGPDKGKTDEVESMLSKDAAYYFNNVLLIVAAVLLLYLTICSALPLWLPFGGQSISTGAYNAIARPLGIIYLAVLSVCPLLGWKRTDRRVFLRQARVPAVLSVALFAALMVVLLTRLVPAYDAIIAAGGMDAEGLASEGPAWYYHGLAALGFLVASILFFNALFMLGRVICMRRVQAIGGSIAHLGMAVILIGLIGSSMYVTEVSGYAAIQDDGSVADFTVDDYALTYVDDAVEESENGDDILYSVQFDVYRDGAYVTSARPAVQLTASTMETKSNADVVSFALEDLFVVCNGVNDDGDFSLDVRVNPLISFVWAGSLILVIGIAVAAFGRRRPKRAARPAGEGEKA